MYRQVLKIFTSLKELTFNDPFFPLFHRTFSDANLEFHISRQLFVKLSVGGLKVVYEDS